MLYTGTYKGVDVTIATSGIGQPSMLIYAFELFDTYNVHTIVRIGSCGALARDIKVGDFISLVDAYTDNGMSFPFDQKNSISRSSQTIRAAFLDNAEKLKIPLKERRGFTNDLFYNEASGGLQARDKHDCSVVSMESKILFDIAKEFDRNAASLLLVVDAVLDLEKRRNAGEKLEINPFLTTPIPGIDSLFSLALESIVELSEKN
nr:purine nucleoside phosphorylase DeoD-type-like [Lytechinus pictus]